MEEVQMWTIQRYYGEREGCPWFIWKYISVPKHKVKFVKLMNTIIPLLFCLPEEIRKNIISNIVLMDYNNGVNQYFPHLKDYAQEGVTEFVGLAMDFNEKTDGQYQKAK